MRVWKRDEKKEKKKRKKHRRTDIASLAKEHSVFNHHLAVDRLPQTLDLRGKPRDVGVDVEHGKRN